MATFGLHLQPERSEGVVAHRSEMNDDGRWKNSTGRGAPIYVMFESTNREQLMSLRNELLGPAGAARAQARHDRQAALEGTLDALSPQERTAAMLQAALAMTERLDREFAAGLGDAAGMPGDLANLAETMRQKMAAMLQKAQQKIADTPPDPRIVEQIEGVLRDFQEE